MPLAGCLSTGQQPRSQRWRVNGRRAKKAELLDNSVPQSCSHMRDDYGRDEECAWSWVDVADEFTSRTNDSHTPAIDVDRGVLQAEYGGTALPKSHSSLAGADNFEERVGLGRTRDRTHDKIQYAKTAIRSLNTAMFRSKRGCPTVNAHTLTASTAHPTMPISVDDSPYRRDRQGEGKNSTATALLHAEIEKLQRDLAKSRSLVAELQTRLQAQPGGLESSNSFFSTADISSDSDVIRTLQRLNAEVQQNTTYMADCLAEEFDFGHLSTNSTREQVSAAQRVSRRLGFALVQSLRTNTPEHVPMLLQIAFQAYFAFVLCQAISSWTFDPGYNKFIRETYQRLRSVEAQAVSGRWRSLARIHSGPSWITHPESFVDGILADISDIVLAAGCTAPQFNIITRLMSMFKEKVSLLAELAGGLSKMFDEVVSCDFGVFIVFPGEKFRDKTMEDADDDPVGSPWMEGGTVLCATHIGLIKRVPIGTLWERGKKEKIIVLKAKVLLESFLNTDVES